MPRILLLALFVIGISSAPTVGAQSGTSSTSTKAAQAALAVKIDASADCDSRANLLVSWTGAGNHFEYGLVTDQAGATIGTFGPDASSNDSYTGVYENRFTTAQPQGSIIGSYAWVGTNPPTPSTAIEFFVAYNCSTKAMVRQCLGAYGSCPRSYQPTAVTVAPPVIPTTSREVLVGLALLMAAAGVFFLRRRSARHRA